LEPSVAHPPWPLQEFLPLQPLSLDLHPPWPLQSFLPLQECFSPSLAYDTLLKDTFPAFAFLAVTFAVSSDDGNTGAACNLAAVPPSRPVIAAVNKRDVFEFFMFFLLK
jgi:hypothetical protein